MLDRIDHVGIACHDLAAAIAFYESVFDLTVASRETHEDQGVHEAMLRLGEGPGPSWIQLLEPTGRTRRWGNSWHAGGRVSTTSGTG